MSAVLHKLSRNVGWGIIAAVLILTTCSSTFEYEFDDITLESGAAESPFVQQEILKIEDYLRNRIAAGVVPGAAVSIVRGDEILYMRGINQTPNRLYPVLSFTKTFTALAILKLAEDEKLNLDQSAGEILGAQLEATEFASKKITVRHLLTHTSGIPDSGPIRRLGIYPPLHIPEQSYAAGDRFQYSNPGYRLLGAIVEAVTDDTYQAYVIEHLIGPLQMRQTRFSIRSNGASGMVSSVADLASYVRLYTNRGEYSGERLISEKNYFGLFSTPTLKPACDFSEHRGVAWRIQTYENEVLLMNHAALGLGIGGLIQIYPKHKIGFVFLSNPPTYNDGRYLNFYKELRSRLNDFAVKVGKIDFQPETKLPCALHTVPW